MFRVPIVTGALLLGVAACGGNRPVDKAAETGKTDALPDINAAAPSASGEPHVDTQPAKALPAPSAAIPSALQGRWGLNPADCMARSDAKGLLTISSSELRFYESRAVPGDDVTTDATSAAGNFHYEGEGQSWTKYEALKVEKGRLTRTETKPSASFTYAKCG